MTEEEVVKLAVATVKEYEHKAVEEKRDNRLRNTKLLLENYNYFKAHADKSIYSSEQLEAIDEFGDIDDYRPHMLIQSIKQSSYKTYMMLAHIDKMLKVYEIYAKMEGKSQQRECNVMKKYYIDKIKMTEILSEEDISESTFWRDLKGSMATFSSFLFGFNVIENWQKHDIDTTD